VSYSALSFLPAIAAASVQITEVMYDASGSDDGHEWVEVTNEGSAPVDISKYKFAEGGTNHALKLISGTATLAPATSAIIADDAQTFKTDWPAFNGTLFDSTFNLSNAGETLALKNASSSVEDVISYSSSMGASGDGGSLHRQGGTFIAALPNPGVYPGDIKAVPIVEKPVITKSAPSAAIKNKSTKTTSSSSYAGTKQTAATAYVADFSPQVVSPAYTIPSLYLWLSGLAALIGLGVAGALYARVESARYHVFSKETKESKDEFQIVEN